MSLVTAAMSYLSRSALPSASVSAVLPEPTGPPMPTRSGELSVMTWSRSAVTSGTENPAVLGLVARRQESEARREVGKIGVVERGRALDHIGNAPGDLEKNALPVGLPQGDRLQRRAHLVHGTREEMRGEPFALVVIPSRHGEL